MLDLFDDILGLDKEAPAFFDLLADQLARCPLPEVGLGEEQDARAGDRKKRDEQHPAQLCRGVHRAVEKIDDHQHREQTPDIDKIRELIVQKVEAVNDQPDLERQQQKNQQEPAEDEPKDPLSLRFGKPDDVFIFLDVFHGGHSSL